MKQASGAVLAAIGLGSNLGERRATLERAAAALAALPRTRRVALSQWYETAPVGGPPGQPSFLNGAALLETALTPRELLAELQALERAAGRDRAREARHGPRTLDLDLLVYGQVQLGEPGLTLPHPRLAERRFVLEPLCEIAPELLVPPDGRRVRELLAELAARAPILRFEAPAEASAWCRAWRASGKSLGFVPTMGALHEGHLALVRRARAENDAACVSVFVNPLQFNERRDFERYPRDFEADVRLLERAGCAMVFTGTLAGFFPRELDARGELAPAAWIEPGPSALGLEGDLRPGHFRGVATIVARLFELVQPTRAYFGAKDYQQTLVVRDLVRARGGPEIVVCPTERESSGLARSSRNELLAPAARHEARALHQALLAARAAWRAGERRPAELERCLRSALAGVPLELEYAALRDPEAWTRAAPTAPLERATALLAVRLGGVRLIDNLRLDEGGP